MLMKTFHFISGRKRNVGWVVVGVLFFGMCKPQGISKGLRAWCVRHRETTVLDSAKFAKEQAIQGFTLSAHPLPNASQT